MCECNHKQMRNNIYGRGSGEVKNFSVVGYQLKSFLFSDFGCRGKVDNRERKFRLYVVGGMFFKRRRFPSETLG